MKRRDIQLNSYLAIKGALSESTYRAFAEWNLQDSVKANLARLLETNTIGASSTGWLEQFVQVLRTRYDLADIDRPLIELVQQGWDIDDWRPVLLWHMSRKDQLLRLFLSDWLFSCRERGIVVVTVNNVVDYTRSLVKKSLGSADAWKENTYRRVASGLLKTATEFHLLRGHGSKEFTAYQLPEKSFIYLLHSLMEREQSTKKVVDAADWRLFLLTSEQVENELLRLHQFGKLRFERAGSFLELTLPFDNRSDFIRSEAI